MNHRALAFTLLALLLTGPASGQVINEFVVNHTGTDLYEYLEVFGAVSTDYSSLTILEVDGDAAGGNPGHIDSSHPVGSTNAEGIWWSGYLGDVFPTNDSLTFLLVDGYDDMACAGGDIDSNNDGTIDCTPWSSLLDGVGTGNDPADPDFGDPNDRWYGGASLLLSDFDGVGFPAGGGSRIPNGVDTDAIADWTRNDFDGAGLPLPGNLEPGEATNTPGDVNTTEPPPGVTPMISEVVTGHFANDSYEFVEIFGSPQAGYSAFSIVVLEGNTFDIPGAGTIDAVFPCGTTNIAGFWTSGYQAGTLETNQAQTFLLVEDFTGMIGDDLDTNDDGVLDSEPWSSLVDSVGLSDGFGLIYSTAEVLHPALRSVPAPAGAARFPWFEDSDTAAEWVVIDEDGAGLPGLAGTIASGEAYSTSGLANRIYIGDYYAGLDETSDAALRSGLHAVIDDHIEHPYSSSSTDTWDILEAADEDPNNSSNVLVLYKNDSIAKFGGGSGPYNREHSWPRTFGFPSESAGSPHNDCHHLFLSDVSYNSARGSRLFDTCSSCTEYVTFPNDGVGGVGGGYPGDSNWQSAADGSSGSWETWTDRRGDVARAMFYMDVRYEGGTHSVTGETETDLILTDNRGLIQSTSSSPAYMGVLSTLLEWHQQDPVDANELAHTDAVWTHQGNRNPFVDHPEWVGCIFEGMCALFTDGFESGDTSAWMP